MNIITKILLVIICLLNILILSQNTYAKENINYEKWLTFYYENPQPEYFVEVVKLLHKNKVFKNKDAMVPVAFGLSQIMAQNPSKIEQWMTDLKTIRKKHKRLFNSMLWSSATKEGLELLRKSVKEKEFELYFSTPPAPIYEVDPGALNILDMNWAYFFITGDKKPIINIINAIKYEEYEKNVIGFKKSKKTDEDRRTAFLGAIFKAAKWSLTSNAKQHKKVYEILQNEYNLSTGKRKAFLEGIINDINNYK